MEEEKITKTTEENYQIYFIPAAIIIAGLLIAGSVVWSNTPSFFNDENIAAPTAVQFGNNLSETAKNINPVGDSDHIRGNPNASVTIVEYSDFECPFCARFHPTMVKILDEFPNDVNWVYRHFPLSSIHSSALDAAMASECAAELGGNDAFWQFADKLFDNQKQLGKDLYTSLAKELGLPAREFVLCIDSDRYLDDVRDDLKNATDSGGRGTPFSIILTKNGGIFPFSGALQYESIRSLVEDALKN